MSKLDPADKRYEARAREVLSRALTAGWDQADVFMKVARVSRCEIGPLGIRRNEESDESGLALRVWRKDGTSAFIHADAVLERSLAHLVPVVEPQSARGSRSLIPRLPSEDTERSLDVHEVHEDGCEKGEIQDRARAIVAGFTAHRHVRVDLLQGRIASARIETINLNSAGGRVRHGQSIASIELQARGEPQGGGEPSFVRYAAVTDRADRLDPKNLVEEASWRAAASCGGEPAPQGPVAAVLEPRASAQWVRSLVPRFIHHPSEGSGGGRGAGRIGAAKENPGSAPLLEGVRLLDDPLVASVPSTGPWPALRVPFDGEGRRARLRVLLQDGVVVGRCIDSRDPEASVDDLGPMRRDSYRDAPEPAPLGLVLAPGASSRDELLQRMGKGLFVTSLTPWSKPGSGRLLAEVRGLWMEPGRGSRPIRSALLSLPDLEELSSLVGLGTDLEFDVAGLPVGCPSILFEGVDLLPI